MRSALLAALLFLAAVARALAHQDGAMTYDMECCHSMDCAPVDSVEMVAGATFSGAGGQASLPLMVVTTRYGTAIIPANMLRRRSKDNRLHACIRDGKAICIYVPDGS